MIVQDLAMLNSTMSPKEYWSLPEIAKGKPNGKFVRLYFYDVTNLHQWHSSSDCIVWHPVGKIFILTEKISDEDLEQLEAITTPMSFLLKLKIWSVVGIAFILGILFWTWILF